MNGIEYRRKKIALRLREWGALQRGDFLLANQGRSDVYVDLREALNHGERLRKMASELRGLLYRSHPRLVWTVAHGIGMGGIPLAAAFSCGSDVHTPKEFSWSRTAAKEHGNIRSPELRNRLCGADVDGKGVVIVDDVMTTGESLINDIDTIGWLGGNVVAALVVVDRSDGSVREELALLDSPVHVLSLCTLEDVLECMSDRDGGEDTEGKSGHE